jgi:aerobic carbon-monoxide dehydrogenase medium subunit
MKAASFDYVRPSTLAAALDLLAIEDGTVRAIAGSQSLGPMLNLRLVQPDLLVDITGLPELQSIRDEAGTLVVGACVTHARLEDGGYPDVMRGVLAGIAAGIAYRAIRTRGTIGGSIAHADPAADWLVTATSLGAEVVLSSRAGRRSMTMPAFILGVFETALEQGELITELRFPGLSAQARWGYYKFCRKTGEFAQASAAVLIDPAGGVVRSVIGAASGQPIVITDPEILRQDGRAERVAALLADTVLGDDPYQIRIHTVALHRAIAKATT